MCRSEEVGVVYVTQSHAEGRVNHIFCATDLSGFVDPPVVPGASTAEEGGIGRANSALLGLIPNE